MSSIEIIMTLITAAGGSAVIVAGLAALLGKVWIDRIVQTQKLLQEIDIDLRTKRIGVYEELWKSTAILPKWPKATDVTYEQLLLFSEGLRKWYFEKGGMYLSRSTHKRAYGPLQDALAEVLRIHKTGPVSVEDYETIRSRCSALRTALASDIESRREGPE
ncbi:hypothetical protein LJR084_006800 [Variovorax sp. LjRoot84]